MFGRTFFSVELRLKATDERLEAPQGPRFDAVANPRTVDVTPDQATLLQHLQVLRNGRLRERQFVDDFSTNAAIFSDEEPQDLNTGRVPDGLGQIGKFLVCFRPFNGPEIRSGEGGRATFCSAGSFHRRMTTV